MSILRKILGLEKKPKPVDPLLERLVKKCLRAGILRIGAFGAVVFKNQLIVSCTDSCRVVREREYTVDRYESDCRLSPELRKKYDRAVEAFVKRQRAQTVKSLLGDEPKPTIIQSKKSL